MSRVDGRRRPWRWILALSVLAVGISLGGLAITCGRWSVHDDAMVPAFAPGASVWARRRPYANLEAGRRGDVVIATFSNGERVARIMGLAGDRVALRADRLMINGQELPIRILRTAGPLTIFEEVVDGRPHEIALSQHPAGEATPLEFPETVVPGGHVFLLMDNRRRLNDSRNLGPIPLSAIRAAVLTQ